MMIKVYLELTKIRIIVFTTFSLVTGFLAAGGAEVWILLAVSLGNLLLAGGSSVVNHLQEYKFDKSMSRTAGRPLPSGRISVIHAVWLAVILISLGLLLLLIYGGWLPFALGILAGVWYNGIYTPLKRVTPWAAVPGGVVGAIPPAIGWFAAGGSALEPALWGIVLFFFMWQIPHFWMLLMVFAEDYEKAGFPTLKKVFNEHQIGKLTFIWTIATAVSTLIFPIFGLVQHYLMYIVMWAGTVWLGIQTFDLIRLKEFSFFNIKKAFMTINAFALLIMVIIIVESRLVF